MILDKDGQGLTGRGGRKGQLAVTGKRKAVGSAHLRQLFRRLGTRAMTYFSCSSSCFTALYTVINSVKGVSCSLEFTGAILYVGQS